MTAQTGPLDAFRPGRSASGGNVRVQVLGPVRVWRDNVEVAAGPRQQAYLFALLLAREGRPTGIAELVDLIWGEGAPASAHNVIHKYVGTLRRLLEPSLPAREPGSYLVRRGSHYLLTAGPKELDLVDFRELVTAAAAAVSERRDEAALDHYVEALGLWTGPAGDGLMPEPAAAAIFASLNDEYFETCLAAVELAVSLGQPERVLVPVQLAAVMAPLHEPVHAALITVLGAAGRQVEALSAFQAVRTRLVEELGLDPDRILVDAHQRVLSRTFPLTRRADTGQPQTASRAAASSAGPGVPGLVGRAEEVAVLQQVIHAGFAGRTGLVLVEGEPGVGKTHLLRAITAGVDRRDALVVWASSLEGEGTPSMWPWVQVVGSVLASLPAAARERWLDSDLGRLVEPRDGIPAGSVLADSGTQFRLFERVVAFVGEASAQRPIVVVVDDLHWADVASLRLFSHFTARLPAGTVVIGALRDRVPTPGTDLAHVLALASRLPGHRRIRLEPLDLAEVAELVRRETGPDPDPGATIGIHARTGGNPFFVRELSRFLADGGALTAESASRAGVPATVRDVIKDRVAHLDDNCRDVLYTASLIGREIGLDLLASAVGLDLETCFDRLEPLEALGLLERGPHSPFSCRFTHDVVRESVTEITPSRQVNHLHLRIARALEAISSGDESDVERLAYHRWSAGPLADPAGTAHAVAPRQPR